MEVLQVFVANVLIIGVSALILRQTLPKFTTFRPWYKEWLRQHVRMARADGKGRWRRPKTLDLVFFYYFFVLFVSSLSLLYLRFDTHALFFFFFFFGFNWGGNTKKKKLTLEFTAGAINRGSNFYFIDHYCFRTCCAQFDCNPLISAEQDLWFVGMLGRWYYCFSTDRPEYHPLPVCTGEEEGELTRRNELHEEWRRKKNLKQIKSKILFSLPGLAFLMCEFLLVFC